MGSVSNITGGKGSCSCGKTKYSFTGEPVMQAICHCRNCKKITSSAFLTALLVPSDNFKFEHGAPMKTTTIKHYDAEIEMKPHFCAECGTAICKTADADAFKGLHIVFAGTLDDSDGFGTGAVVPQAELWTKYRLSWVQPLEGAKQCAEFE